MQCEKIHVLLDILGAAAQRLFNCRLVLSGLLAQLKKLRSFPLARNTVSSKFYTWGILSLFCDGWSDTAAGWCGSVDSAD